jgi:hypothetical protein
MDRRGELLEVIRSVRNRWRQRLAIRGAVVVVAGTLLALFLSASSLQALRFSPAAIITFRVAAIAVFALLVWQFLARAMRRQVSDSQVAMYLEENDPTLEAAILSAIEATSNSAISRDHSPHLVEKLVDQAITQCRELQQGHAIDRKAVKRHVMMLGAVGVAAALLLILGPAYLRQGMSALLVITRAAEKSSPYSIEVRPGNKKVPRGSDQAVSAQLVGFTSKDATLMTRTSAGAEFERIPLVAGSNPSLYEGMLFHLDKGTDYYVEANGVKSATFTMSVLDLPTVGKLELEYHFPAYTGLPVQKVETGGDVAALRGTEVWMKVTPTMTAPDGKILVNESNNDLLTKQADGTFTGKFTVKDEGFYKIQLTGPHGEQVDASPKYTIDVLKDQPPVVSFTKPGRDNSASPVEEVFVEAKASDDFGVKQLQLVYSVNGGAEKTIQLFGEGKPLQEVSAGHTIYLEELDVKPGDFVSYYAKATDNNAAEGAKTTTSDIYFVNVRPFRKDFKPAQSQAGGGGGGGGDVGQLSEQQRQIVAATFNTVRDKPKLSPEKYRENVVFLNLAQAKLRAQVDELVGKLQARVGVVDPGFKAIAEALPKASAEMKTAEGNLKAQQAKEALTPEQRALKLLQDAEQNYEMQVRQGGGGGGGGQQSQLSEDLADLFELELDKLANQYEMQKRAEQQSGDRQVDELAEKLKDLARRQQQEAERQRRMAAAGQQSSGGGSGSQRQLADELEEAARRLEQLTREQQRQDLSDAAKQMRDAAQAMRQAAANGSRDGGAQAAAALDKLRQAQQKLERNQGDRAQRDIETARQQAEALANEQKQVASDVNGLEGAQAGADRQQKAQNLAQRKEAMDAKVGQLQKDLEQIANDTRRDQKDASRKLEEAAGTIRDKRVREKIRYSRAQLGGTPSDYAKAMEDDIGANLDALQRKIGEAGSALGNQSKKDQLGRAADKAGDLVRNLQSINERMRQQQAQARNGQGQQNAKGQQGQPGQSQAQNGQSQQGQGQQGQQGQGQQGQQGQGQGQQGQQGQGQGQQGQQGQGQGQQGQQGGDGGRVGNPNGAYGGGPRYGSDTWTSGFVPFNPNDRRQFAREFREWQGDAAQLRRELSAAGVNPKDLDDVIRDLKQFGDERGYEDLKGLEKLQAAALERLQQFEFNLRKKAEPNQESLALSGSDEVPAGFRTAIEEYYRQLAKNKK